MFSEIWRSFLGGLSGGGDGSGGVSAKRQKTNGIDTVRFPSSSAAPAQPRRQQQQQHRHLASTLAARVVSSSTLAPSGVTFMGHETNTRGVENGVGVDDGATMNDDDGDGPDLETQLARPPAPPPRWPPGAGYVKRPSVPDSPAIRAPLLGGDIFGLSPSSTAVAAAAAAAVEKRQQPARPSYASVAAAGANNNNNSGRSVRRVHGPSTLGRPASGRARGVGGAGGSGGVGAGGRSGGGFFVPARASHAPLASERAARVVAPPSSLPPSPWENAGRFAARPRAVNATSVGGGGGGGGAAGVGVGVGTGGSGVSLVAPPLPPLAAPPLARPPPISDRVITREEAFAQGMSGGNNGGGGGGREDPRPDLGRLRRVAAMSLDGGGGGGGGDDEPVDPVAEAEALAAEKAAYAAEIAAVGAAARQRADEELTAMRDLLDRVNLSSSSSAPPPPSATVATTSTFLLPSRPALGDASLLPASATEEEARLRSQERAAGDARRLLFARARARADAERAAIAEAEREVRAARAAAGRAAARAEKLAAANANASTANAAAEQSRKKKEEKEKAADDEIILSDSDDDDEEEQAKAKRKAKPKPKPEPPVGGDDEVLLLSSSSDDDEGKQQRDLSSALESGLALEDEDEDEEEDETSTTVDLASLAAAASAAGLPPSAAPALARLTPKQRRAALFALTAPGRRLPGGAAGGGGGGVIASADDVVAVHPRTRVPLLRGKAASLVGRSWLNDEVMNMANDCLQDWVIEQLRKREEEEEEEEGEQEEQEKNGRTGADGDETKIKKQPHHPPRTHYFSSFFLTKLMSPGENGERYNYAGVRRWTAPARLSAIYAPKPPSSKQAAETAAAVAAARSAARIKVSSSSSKSSSSSSSLVPVRLKNPPKCVLTDCDLLVFPVHLGVHWACCVVDLSPGRREIDYYDSMAGEPREHVEAIRRWLRDEAEDKLATVFADVEPKPFAVSDFEGWKINYLDATVVPQQGNGSDCGVFALRFAANAGRGLLSPGGPGPDFAQRDMDTLRLLIAADLVMGTASATPRRR